MSHDTQFVELHLTIPPEVRKAFAHVSVNQLRDGALAPWKTLTIELALVPNTELMEYICNENEKSLQHMVGKGAK